MPYMCNVQRNNCPVPIFRHGGPERTSNFIEDSAQKMAAISTCTIVSLECQCAVFVLEIITPLHKTQQNLINVQCLSEIKHKSC